MALKHAAPGEVIDLRALGPRLSATRTHAIVRTSGFEAVRLVVPAGAEISSHSVPGAITLQCIEGHARVGLSDEAIDMWAGDWIWLDADRPHSVKGIRDASLILTILFEAGCSAAERVRE
jgi:quercetin dioxygenase-like cupin family protein